MAFPFKYKPPFREIFDVIAGRDGKLADIRDFHSYMKQSFNPDIVEKYAAIKPVVIDQYFAFISECQKDSGVSFDDIMWNFIDKFIRHQIFDGKDTMDMKPLRSFYDPYFKSIRLDPEALFSKHCGAAATTATATGLLAIIRELQPKGTPLTELLRAALPKNKPLKPPPAMRMASPRKNTIIAAAKPEIKIPASPSAAAAAAEKEKSDASAAAGAKKTTPASPTSTTTPLKGVVPSATTQQKTVVIAEAKKDDSTSNVADNESVADSVATGGTNNSTAANNNNNNENDEESNVNAQKTTSAINANKVEERSTNQQNPEALALLAGNRQVTIQTTSLGQKQQQQQQLQQTNNNSQQQQSQNNNNNQQAFVPIQHQHQHQHHNNNGASLLYNNNNTNTSQQQQLPQLQFGFASPSLQQQQQLPPNVPQNILAALNEIESRHEKLRTEIDQQITAVSTVDGFLGQISHRIAHFHRENPIPLNSNTSNNNNNNQQQQNQFQISMKQEQELQLSQIRQKIDLWCKMCNFELEKLLLPSSSSSHHHHEINGKAGGQTQNKILPKYVADLGKQVESGKLLQHLPNEDFGEVRLQELLLSLKKDQDEYQQKEQVARKLDELALQEELLKLEILKMEHDHQQQQQQQKQDQFQQQQQPRSGGHNSSSRNTINNSNASSPLSPVTPMGSSGGNNNNLSIAQRIAARVQVHSSNNQSGMTSNFILPGASK